MADQVPQYLAIAVASGLLGYWLHTTPIPSVPLPPSKPTFVSEGEGAPRKNKQKQKQNQPEVRPAETIPAGSTQDPSSDSEDERAATTESNLNGVKAGRMEECKLVLVVNMELGMAKGKMAAQCSHATLACYKTLQSQNPALVRHWEHTGQAKVAVKAASEAELLELQRKARSLNLCARSIQDAGRTQIAAGSRTVLGIGPGPVKLINQVTGHLKLL